MGGKKFNRQVLGPSSFFYHVTKVTELRGGWGKFKIEYANLKISIFASQRYPKQP